jgi:hypothetical protein
MFLPVWSSSGVNIFDEETSVVAYVVKYRVLLMPISYVFWVGGLCSLLSCHVLRVSEVNVQTVEADLSDPVSGLYLFNLVV